MCLECQNLLLIKQQQILKTPSYNKTGADYGKDSKGFFLTYIVVKIISFFLGFFFSFFLVLK